MRFSQQFIDSLVSRCDIVDVVSEYVRLDKRSGNNYWGLCPFHNEKTPSFSANPDKQIAHCFGCGKGGNVIGFVMEAENLDFVSAIEFLAQKYNIPLEQQETDREYYSRREKLLGLCRSAAMFFHKNLSTQAAAPALEYINRRGLSAGAVKKFGIGYAPESWDALIMAMTAQGYTKEQMLEAGLVVKNQKGGLYDKFRNRLMFPIIDIKGNVIAFGGRLVGDGEPKYLNSPETPIFHKGKNLYALNIAKKSKAGRIILVEGYMDVVSLHQEGFDSVVASLGTALTADQAGEIGRYAKQVVIAYDSDNAGLAAAKRATQLLNNAMVEVKILRMTGAKDPDEYIKKKGRDAFLQLLNMSENHIEYRLANMLVQYDLNVDAERVEYLKSAVELLSEIKSSVELEVYASNVAKSASISKDAVVTEVKELIKKKGRKENREKIKKELSPVKAMSPTDRQIKYENVVSARAEEGVLYILSNHLDMIASVAQRLQRSEERRVGKECRSRWSPYH